MGRTSLTVLMFGFILASNCIMFQLLKKNTTCVKIPGKETYVVQFVSSGENDRNIRLQIYNNYDLMMRKENINEFKQTLKFQAGVGSICFTSLDGELKSISFEYYHQKAGFKGMIDKDDFSLVNKSLEKTLETLKNIKSNQNFHIERHDTNRVLLEQSEHKIKCTGVIKIIFLVASSLIQLWIMKGFFQNKGPYQPVELR